MDDRWNGGGFYRAGRAGAPAPGAGVDDNQPRGRRHAAAERTPERPESGVAEPLVIVDGDIFPYLFKLYGLGKLIGTRSWAGCAASAATGRCWTGASSPSQRPPSSRPRASGRSRTTASIRTSSRGPARRSAGRPRRPARGRGRCADETDRRKPAGYPPAPPLLPAYPASGIVAPKP